MNLLFDKWIPVQRKNGMTEKIAPFEITDGIDDNPIIRVSAPRPDFNGALMQFLIGLLQTAIPPQDEIEWEDLYDDPPQPEWLKEHFLAFADAFEFDGDGLRFMQDLELKEDESERKPITSLLIEAPGNKAIREHTDHFIKNGFVNGLCIHCAAAALFTLQTNAPAGGVGHRTSLRGGGPLTTIIVSSPRSSEDLSFWHTLWLNVFSKDEFENLCGNPEKDNKVDIFPWLGPTRTSEPKGGKSTFPNDTNPLQTYWGMPRRIRIDFESSNKGLCDLCGTNNELITHYITKNYGINYEGPWKHPLSPHRIKQDGTPIPLHPQPGGIGYRHWLGLAIPSEHPKIEPAAVVSSSMKNAYRRKGDHVRLHAFGFDMDNMKARCWHESLMPVYHLPAEIAQGFHDAVRDLIESAQKIASNLRKALKKAWFSEGANTKGDTGFIELSFWQDTEPQFYQLLHKLYLNTKENKDDTSLRHQWFTIIDKKALELFDIWATSGEVEYMDLKRIAKARNSLRKDNKKMVKEALKLK